MTRRQKLTDLTERTLHHLCQCEDGEVKRDRIGQEHTDSTWADLLAAIMEGFERGWIGHAEMWRGQDGYTHIEWRATRLGEREIANYIRRLMA